MMDDELNTHLVVELIDKFVKVFDGYPSMETLAALMSLTCEIITSSAGDMDEMDVLYNASMMMLSADIRGRLERGECGWQNEKQ